MSFFKTLFIFLLTAAAGCSAVPIVQDPPRQFNGALNDHPINHVVIFAIDGLERDTFLKYLKSAPRKPGGFHDLLGARVDGDGLVFTHAIGVNQGSTVFPSYTYPSWTSMLTGVFPGAHGITGNSVFFRDRQVIRYYTEYHIDAVRVQLEKNFFSNDINEKTKTVYEHVGEAGGRSIVVYNMVNRGGEAVKPDLDTLLNYRRNRSRAVDENSLWDTVHALEEYNKAQNATELRLPTVLTIYFSGLDHVEHVSPEDPEQARVEYLGHLDNLIAKFIAGDAGITRNHYETPMSDLTQIDAIKWRGLNQEPVFKRTLFLLVSDHGHTPIEWNHALGIEDLKVMFEELSERTHRSYILETPDLIDETLWSKVRASMGFVEPDRVPMSVNVVATLNGGSLGFHVRAHDASWQQRPEYTADIKPVLEYVLLVLHKNERAPQAVLYKSGNKYVFVPYRYTGSAIHLLPSIPMEQSPLNTADYPMAVRRVNGLASSLPTDPMSAPDIILLADRSKKLSYANKQDWRVIEKLNIEEHRHFHSDHGHLDGSDSLVPIFFAIGDQNGRKALPTLCEASIVDVAPTLLDLLDLLPAYEKSMQGFPDEVKGYSLKRSMKAVLNGADGGKNGSGNAKNVCPAKMTIHDSKNGR